MPEISAVNESQGPLTLTVSINRQDNKLSISTTPLSGLSDLRLLLEALAYTNDKIQVQVQIEQARAEGFAAGKRAAEEAAKELSPGA